MSIAANAVFTMVGYRLEPELVYLQFRCLNPGPGNATDYEIALTDAEITSNSNTQLRTLVEQKLLRLFRPTTLTTKLDTLVGQSITIA